MPFPQFPIYIEGYRKIYLPINCFDLRSWQCHTVGGADVSRRDGWEERWEELRMVSCVDGTDYEKET
jgi:hypothetical protein